MDYLTLTGLKATTHIGLLPFEKKIQQTISIDIRIGYSFITCEDNVQNVIDYSTLANQVIGYVESHAFLLIERMANEIALLIENHYALAQTIEVTIHKPQALSGVKDIQVTASRVSAAYAAANS